MTDDDDNFDDEILQEVAIIWHQNFCRIIVLPSVVSMLPL